jgi:hypothetical protein
LAEARIAVHGGLILREPHKRRRIGHRVAHRIVPHLVELPVARHAEWTQVPFDGRVGRVVGELERSLRGTEIVVVSGGCGIAKRYERAAFVVGDDVTAVADGVDADQRHTARRAVVLARGLPQPAHFDRRRQCLADSHRSVQDHAAIEQVGHDASGGDSALPDREVQGERGVDDRSRIAGHRVHERS